ncbi:ethanolamine utilization protein [Crassaminicella thermophila]|uniref:Ethanolamine utilization protein n=1 Tax=Crassaminicella thermophila TaxID=2599308 RepID=A0A5C0SC13_CRATE|nr:ethanolamine utilization protein [Crassaminicella thermophila]QEK11467.1 ethanolamine utilization protein [Crassaminicella thermophila]
MKFITEEGLRELFRKEPFTTYEIEVGQRLTPGARQFLRDRGINIIDDGPIITSTEGVQSKELKMMKNWKKKMFYSRMKSIEALFLITAEDILSRDIFLAQSVINLGKQFSTIKNAIEEKNTTETFCCKECSGIKADNFSDNLGDCFEITEFHIQLKKGRDIIILHRLRCALRELEPFILELFEDNDNEFCKEVIGKVNQSINTLSQIICSIVGGKICQRKN